MASPPSNERASAGVTSDGTLDVRRVDFVGTWQGAGARHVLLNLQPADQGQRDRPLHGRVGADDAGREGRHGGDPVPVPGSDPEHRPRGAGHRRPREQPSGSDPARRRRARRNARLRRRAPGGGAGQSARDGAAPLQARLARHRRRDRRRPADRPRGGADLPRRRALHDEPADAACAAQRRRPARGRAHHPHHGRRPPARLLGRDDELRAGPGDGPAWRCHRDGARQRRLGHDGIQRDAAQPSLRARAAYLDGAPVGVHGRLRAAGGCRRLARRRRGRRPAEPALQARPSFDGDGEADAPGRQQRLRGFGDEAAGELRRTIPASGRPSRP